MLGIIIIGSVFIPSKVFLARMKFRPWNGVFLSESYLNDVEVASTITREIIQIYNQNGIELLIESAVKSEKDITRLCEFLSLDKVEQHTQHVLNIDSSEENNVFALNESRNKNKRKYKSKIKVDEKSRKI